MKKIISLILTICVVFSLYSYCFNNGEALSFTQTVEKITSTLGDISDKIQGLLDIVNPELEPEEAKWYAEIVQWIKDHMIIIGPATPMLPPLIN